MIIGSLSWWRSSFTLREADLVEAWRRAYPDHVIAAHVNGATFRLAGRTHQDIRDYLERNPRRTSEAA